MSHCILYVEKFYSLSPHPSGNICISSAILAQQTQRHPFWAPVPISVTAGHRHHAMNPNFNGNYGAPQQQHHSGNSQGHLNPNQANQPVGRVASQQSHVVNQPGSSGYASNVYAHQTNATTGNPSLASNQYGRLSGLQAVAQQQQAGQAQPQYAQGLPQPANSNALAGQGQMRTGAQAHQQGTAAFASPQRQMFAGNTAAQSSAGFAPSTANNRNVPNPLGVGGAGVSTGAAGNVSKTDLLRSMYQSRQVSP